MGKRARRTAAHTAILTLAAILPLTAGCSGQSKRPTAPVAAAAGPIDEPLTPDVATRAFRSYVVNDDVARASGDERLALSWADDGQAQLIAAEFRKAAFTGEPVPRYGYTDEKLYVPRLTQYPQWFVVSAGRTPMGKTAEPGKTTRASTTLMAFVRKLPSARWKLSLSTLLGKHTKPLEIPVDKDGYATPLATFDIGLTIQPRIVPAMQATLAEEGPDSLATKVMRAGRHTTDYYLRDQRNHDRDKEHGLAYDSVYAATGLPIYSLRTADGGGLVLYALSRDTVTFVKDNKHGRLSVPRNAAHLLDTIVLKDELDVTETLQFGTTVPAKPKSKNKQAGKAVVIAADGAVTTAETTKADD